MKKQQAVAAHPFRGRFEECDPAAGPVFEFEQQRLGERVAACEKIEFVAPDRLLSIEGSQVAGSFRDAGQRIDRGAGAKLDVVRGCSVLFDQLESEFAGCPGHKAPAERFESLGNQCQNLVFA